MTNVNVSDFYEINSNTTALAPAKHFDYQTIIYETDQVLYVNKRPLELIEPACMEGGATYDGRRLAVIHQTGAKHKVPIPIAPNKGIFAFPTLSPSQYDCHWIFYQHVRQIKPHPSKTTQSLVYFKNGQDPLELSISYPILEKQMHRTSFCIVRFS
ncbi:competence protein ComK [Pullulanibacillus sp. KACC 23026]|uniref:competence protein ComK n=1 Tax=Pullulanibacillus sp. KACC 23026 TaxID=3028315 RepID=UPI0023B1D3B3|nr:competence protein ComK [Pullulanibacillus sp. KACC 23026]WEG13411.1 competence protein ComK [Pullulanibacillus sp. KACC 23026]